MSSTANPGRAAILERIRSGLSSRASASERAAPATGATPATRTIDDQPIFEPVSNPLERFLLESKSNLMECIRTEDASASSRELAQVLESLPPGEIFVQDHPMLRTMLRQLVEAGRITRLVRWSSQGAPSESSQATVSLVEALIAQTGSIFVSAACGGRGASVVAPCHIAYAKLSQLVPDVDTALRNASQQDILGKNSFACVISGSSRTADIEKIMVQGAHGPRRLVVILEG